MDCLRACLSVCLINEGRVGGPFEGLSVCVSHKCGAVWVDRLWVCLSVCLRNLGGVGGLFEGLSVCVSHKCGRCRGTV